MLNLRTLLVAALTIEAVVACAPSAAVYDAPTGSRKKDSGAAPLPDEEVPPEGEIDAGVPLEEDAGVDESTDASVLPRDAGTIKGRLDGGGAQCRAVTLGRDVPQYTCVQAARNSMWYICDNAAWIEVSPDDPACIAKFPL